MCVTGFLMAVLLVACADGTAPCVSRPEVVQLIIITRHGPTRPPGGCADTIMLWKDLCVHGDTILSKNFVHCEP